MERLRDMQSGKKHGTNYNLFCSAFMVLTLLVDLSCQYNQNTHEQDACAIYDTCNVKQFFRTCSCESDCYRYGTCCKDSDKFNKMSINKEDFQCYSEGTPSPVFAKRACADGWDGDQGIREGCLEKETINTTKDFMSQVLVSSNRTETTYWNWNCALCNGERINDLIFWTVQVSCFVDGLDHHLSLPQAKANFAYNRNGRHWGINTNGKKFIPCAVTFYQPAFLMGRLRLCAPNMISSCPITWTDWDTNQKCLSYHAERKNKKTGVYYRNRHCAECNGMSVHELLCLGRNYRTLSSTEDSRVLKIVFNLNSWTGEHEEADKDCQIKGRRYDPFLRFCRDLSLGITNETLESVDYELLTGTNKAPSKASFLPVSMIIIVILFHLAK